MKEICGLEEIRVRITDTQIISQARKDGMRKHTFLCPCIQTFELDSANTRVTSHLVSSFAVIFPDIGTLKIKDMKTCIKIF